MKGVREINWEPEEMESNFSQKEIHRLVSHIYARQGAMEHQLANAMNAFMLTQSEPMKRLMVEAMGDLNEWTDDRPDSTLLCESLVAGARKKRKFAELWDRLKRRKK